MEVTAVVMEVTAAMEVTADTAVVSMEAGAVGAGRTVTVTATVTAVAGHTATVTAAAGPTATVTAATATETGRTTACRPTTMGASRIGDRPGLSCTATVAGSTIFWDRI
jgi:hypothetical protein